MPHVAPDMMDEFSLDAREIIPELQVLCFPGGFQLNEFLEAHTDAIVLGLRLVAANI